MGRRSAKEEINFNGLIKKCYDYLNTNFNRFPDRKRTQIALDLLKRAMPSTTTHQGNIGLNLNNLVSDVKRRRKTEAGDGTSRCVDSISSN